MKQLTKIAEINADSFTSVNELINALKDKGYTLVGQEGYPESFYVCKEIGSNEEL